MKNIARLRDFVQSFTQLTVRAGSDNEEQIFTEGKVLLSALVSHDDWLPDEFARSSAEKYQQFLLYCDPLEHFSVVSFVWGPGQTTPVHDHTVWGIIGVMRGVELCEEFTMDSVGKIRPTGTHQLMAGEVDLVSPRIGDVHKVSNALEDRLSLSIHVYGANIGAVKRHIYNLDGMSKRAFISGYSSDVVPNIWDRSVEMESVC